MALSRETKVGMFFLGGVALFIAFIEVTVGTGILERRYPLWIELDDVGGLSSGAPVRVAGVPSGTVGRIELEPDRVRVELLVEEGVEIREDAVATLQFQLLSGSGFVVIDRGTPGVKPLEPGATITTKPPVDLFAMIEELEGVATSVRDLSDSLNENQDVLLTNVNRMLEENRQALGSTIQNFSLITEKLATGQGTLARLLDDPRLYDEAVLALETLRATFGDVQAVTSRLAAGEGTIGRMLVDDGLYDDVRETMVSLRTTMENTREITDQIRLGEGTLGRLLVDDALYLEAEEALYSLTRASQGIEDQAPISVVGTLLGTLF